jgi:hypothetical protein
VTTIESTNQNDAERDDEHGPRECRSCYRIMSEREWHEQRICNDCSQDSADKDRW